jgi:hypothetical protein
LPVWSPTSADEKYQQVPANGKLMSNAWQFESARQSVMHASTSAMPLAVE